MLNVKELCSGYGEFEVLHSVSIDIKKGSIVGILGPNGHGKSTLMKTVCGLVPLSSGSITFQGENIQHLSIQQIVHKGLMYIPEERNLFPKLTIKQNLELGAHVVANRKEKAKHMDNVFSLFPPLKKYKKRHVSTLSGGERRMAAVGRGLMADPTFLEIDEPTLGLAPNLVAKVFDQIEHIREGLGITILLVEQEIKKTLEIGDKYYLLEEGEIVLEKQDANKFLEDPAIRRTLLGIEQE